MLQHATLSVFTAGVAIFVEWSFICNIAFIVPLLTSPYTVHQRQKLNKLPTLREEHNKLRLTVNRLQAENNELSETVDKLESEVKKVNQIEGELKEICDAQGQNVDQLQAQIRENGAVMKEIKELQETEVMQQILTAVIASDTSGDFKIDDREMDLLILRLRALPTVRSSVTEAELREKLKASQGSGMSKLYKLTTDLVDAERKEKAETVPDIGPLPEIS
uniref:Uncharacterized protein n=1 Tax=Grammatophora oceanica TaxID=210454 RepID=A0A7S1UWZ7_9STRA|mmetsp:Transcript_27340/g.40043  ORF Transcript_27340/g.40043 Transcript_27340/m.40043 type:complete len:220 (+) Transcript_27340:73-732(+)